MSVPEGRSLSASAWQTSLRDEIVLVTGLPPMNRWAIDVLSLPGRSSFAGVTKEPKLLCLLLQLCLSDNQRIGNIVLRDITDIPDGFTPNHFCDDELYMIEPDVRPV